jgi:hypothetical protein
VRTMVEDAHQKRKVRILENPDDSFEDAQPFSKVRNFWCASSRRKKRGWVFRRRRLPRAAACSGTPTRLAFILHPIGWTD